MITLTVGHWLELDSDATDSCCTLEILEDAVLLTLPNMFRGEDLTILLAPHVLAQVEQLLTRIS